MRSTVLLASALAALGTGGAGPSIDIGRRIADVPMPPTEGRRSKAQVERDRINPLKKRDPYKRHRRK